MEKYSDFFSGGFAGLFAALREAGSRAVQEPGGCDLGFVDQVAVSLFAGDSYGFHDARAGARVRGLGADARSTGEFSGGD